jgi:hypothetical protein
MCTNATPWPCFGSDRHQPQCPVHAATWTNPDIVECDWTGVECDDDDDDNVLFGTVVRLVLEDAITRGHIPDDLGLLTGLKELSLSGNALTGTIPTSFAALTALTYLALSDNQLNGTAPFCNGSIPTQPFNNLSADCDEVSCPCCTRCG